MVRCEGVEGVWLRDVVCVCVCVCVCVHVRCVRVGRSVAS